MQNNKFELIIAQLVQDQKTLLENIFTFVSSKIQMHGFDILVILLLAWVLRRAGTVVIDRLIRHLIRSTRFNDLHPEDAKKRQDTLISMFNALWSTGIWIVAALMVVQELGVQTTPLLASAGIIGIALGFGAQSLIKDLLSGIFIILENQYRVGDVVDLEGASGTVEQITIRSTVLRDADGNVHFMPNGNVMHVINKTMGFSKINLTIAVQPDTNIDNLAEIINNVGEKMAEDEKWGKKIIDPPRFLNIGNFTETMLEVKIMGKTEASEQWGVTGEFRKRLLKALNKHSIELAQVPFAGFPAAAEKKK